MGNLIRTVGFGGTNDPVIKRAIGVLSDGSVVAMVCDMNQTSVSGDGGDGTGVPKIHFYHSTNRTTWTLKATVNAPAATAQNLVLSFCVDSANNLHLTYRWGSTFVEIRYVKLTFAAGPVWTVGPQVVVNTGNASGTTYMSLLEIDTIGNSPDFVVIGAYWYQTTGAKKAQFMSYVRTTGGSWVASGPDPIITGDSHLGYADDMTLAGDNVSPITNNRGIFAYYVTRKGANGTDHGDVLRVVTVDSTTGARIAAGTSYKDIGPTYHKGYGGGFRKFWLFNTAADQFDLAGIVDTSDFKCSLFRFHWNRSNDTYGEITPRAVSRGKDADIWRRTNNHNWASVAHNGGGRYFFFANCSGQIGVATGRIENGTNKVFFDDGWQKWDNGYGAPGGFYDTDGKFKAPTVAPVEQVFSGATRNWTANRVDAMMFHHKESGTPQSFRMESRSLLVPLAPGDVTPWASSTVSTDRPELSALYKLQMYYAQIKTRMEWQIASDAGFSTNLRTITESGDDYVLANGTPTPYNAIVRAREALPAIAELAQGTWYIRARTIDWSFNYGPWSSGHSFVITHPPQGANLYPTAGAVFLYAGSGQVTFTWKFTDPSPYDNQTAYRIVVEDANDGAVVLDSGKVASGAQSATLNIPVSGKDIDLRWRLSLWDSDDIEGPTSAYQMFYVTDPPAPTITSPVNGAVLSSGIPTISWTPGIGGTKVQQRHRVLVTVGANIIYNSDWIDSADTSHTLPVGYLSNDQQYTFRVEVQDDLGLGGFAEISVSTDWVEPIGPADNWEVFVHDYPRRGYVYITWTDENMDPDFSSWNVYRRLVGEANWTHIAAVTTGADRYAFRDYFVGSGRTYEYTITQMVDRFGDLIESSPTRIVRVTPDSDNYWLIDQIEPGRLSIPLYQVTNEPFTEEYEQETTHIIGAGRYVEYGDRLGYVGSLSLQLRDKFTAGMARENYVLNPALSFRSGESTMPDGWLHVAAGNTGEVSLGYVESRNPSPSGKTPFRAYAAELGNTNADSIRLETVAFDLPPKLQITGATAVLSVWLDHHPDNADKAYRLSVAWVDALGVQITQNDSAALTAADAVDSYIPSTSVDAAAGNAIEAWKRFRSNVTVPVGAVKAVVKIRVQGNGGAAATPGQLIVGGVQFEANQMTEYMDGDQFGVDWSGTPYLSYSFGNGYYTARQQRLALERIKAQKTWVHLRNPFGDIWRVAPGDISVQRIPGVGRSEFTDVEIPYQEVKR